MHDGSAGTFRTALAAARRPLAGLWMQSGSPLVAEICADAGLDWLMIDLEHDPRGPESATAQLRTVRRYPVAPVVRVPDAGMLCQVLDLGVQDVVVPVGSVDEARAAAETMCRAPREDRSLVLQVAHAEAVAAAARIAAVDGVDGVFLDPSDLAASMGQLGAPTHPDVVAVVRRMLREVRSAGVPVGVSAFDPAVAEACVADGAAFVLVGTDVTILAQGARALAARTAWPVGTPAHGETGPAARRQPPDGVHAGRRHGGDLTSRRRMQPSPGR